RGFAESMGCFETQWLAAPKNFAALADLSGQLIPSARPKATPWHRARHGFKREPDPRRAGDERLERPLRLHLLSPAVRVQPVWRPRTPCSACRQHAQRRRLGRRAQARCGALPGKGLTHLFSSGRSLCNARGLRVSGGGADQIRDPTTGRPGPAEQDRLSAHAPSRTTPAPCAPVPCQFQLSGRNLDQVTECYRQGRVAHPGELYPRVGFIVTNMSRPAERLVAFYNKRGTCEQWIKEGKGAIKWTRLSCRTFAANAVRLQLHALAYNLGNFLRTLATPEPIKDWSLTSLKDKLIKIGAKVVSHGRYVIFQMAEVAIARQMFQEILRLIAELRPQPPPALA